MIRERKIVWFAALFCGLLASSARAQDQDPPTRAARLSYFDGAVSMQPAGIDQWAPVEVNRPFTTGDYLYTDQKAIAELHLDSAVFRMGEVTSFGFLNINDQIAQLKLTEGDLYFRVHDLAPSQVYEIDTPNAAISLLREGVYRIHVDPNSNTTFLVVREGQAEVTGGGQAFTLNPGQSASLSGAEQLAYDIEQAPAPDALDNWCMERDRREMQASATRYVPPSMVGYEDLDQNGGWTESPDYGPVWYPTHVDPDWAPYHDGHWVWVEPWGWTWVDAQPWGFAPSHYGRWVYWHERWGWAPGPVAVVYARPIRPVYAPALVAWFGGAHWGVSLAIGGGGPSLGWVPLGFGEVYTPHYHCSPAYFEHVNVYNTRVMNNVNITNVYRTVYVQHNVYNQTFVNARAPRAVVAMQSAAFASGRPVRQDAHPVAAEQFARMRGAQVIAPGVVPTRNGVAPTLGQAAARPNQAFMNRQVVARSAAPAGVASFAARQAFLQQHVGQPHDFAAMHRAIQPQARPVSAVVQAPRARMSEVHVGQRVGNLPPAANVARGTGEPQRPNVPSAAGQPRQTYQQPPNHPQANQGQPNQAHPDQRMNRTEQESPNAQPRQAPAMHGVPPNQLPNRNSQHGVPAQTPRQYEQPNRGTPAYQQPNRGSENNGGNAAAHRQDEQRSNPRAEQVPTTPEAHGEPTPPRREAAPPQPQPQPRHEAAPPSAPHPEEQRHVEEHSNNTHASEAHANNAHANEHPAEHASGHSEQHKDEHKDEHK